MIDIKVSWIKASSDENSFKVFKNMGLNVIELQNPEDVDATISGLIEKKCNNIVLSNEVASFSDDVVKKYNKSSDVKIIITPTSKE